MENYFILLELPFDLPESDTNKISEAISKKQAQWSRDQSNPVKKAKASEYLAALEDIKKVMLDPTARKQEAAKAKQIKASKAKELEAKLSLYRAKGDELSEKDLKRLVKIFGAFGFTADEIKKKFGSGNKKQDKIDPSEVLDKTQARNVQNFMQQLDMKEKTLYDFLSLAPTASWNQLCEAADSMKKKILAKGDKTGRDNAVQSLCGLCVVIFKDVASKKKYDNYVNLTKYRAVNEAVDELALSNQKRIEPKMKESLIDIAVRQYHVSVSDASVYINHYCEYMGYALPENKIVCGLCGTENPAGTTNCVKCGKPLIIPCPACSAENNNSAKVCAKCGFDLTKMDKAVELLHQAKQKYSEKALEEAERLVKEAKAYWPNHADVLGLEKTIQDERKQAADTIAAIMKDIQDKKMYAAQTKIDQAKANGFSIDPSVASKVTAVLKEVESQLAIMRNASGDEAFTIAMKLTELIADSDELNQSLKKFPPDEVPAVSSKRVGDEITLTWKPSPSIGEITYVVVRKENTYPNGPTDGSTVYNGKELAYTDSNAPKNTVLYYSVFAVRIGVHSKATRLDEAVAIVGKVTNLKAIGGDEMVTLSWTKAPTVTEIRLYKYCGYERPQDDSQYETIPCTRLDGLLVSGLTNGTNYWFAISAGHTLNGKTYFSEKAYLSAVPQKPAKPLQDFSVQLIDEVFQAKWTQSEWDVILFYAKQKPEYAVGTIYDLNELLSKYEKIDINLKSLTEAEFRLNFVGECYIVPGVINASNVILNVASYISSVPRAKDVSFDINSAATEMYVNFTWPKKIDRSLLVYRMDSYPTGIDDPLAHKVECSKRQYEANEGILISNPAKGTFYAEVYIYFESDGHRVYSDACRALLSNEPQKDVFYTLKYKKAGLFSKKCTLTVEIETEGACVFPSFAIVSKFKSTPLKRGDGDIVCTVNDNTEIKGSHTFEFDVSPMKADTRLKMFFLNDKNYKSFKIACKAGNSI